MSDQDNIYSKDLSVYFYDEITEKSTVKLIQELKSAQDYSVSMWSSLGHFEKIRLHINSPGGTAHDSFSISNFIKNSSIPIDTYIDGMCASGASIISLSGNVRYMNKNSLVLIHQLSSSTWGTYQQLKDTQKMNDVLMDMIISFYLNHTSIKKKILKKILKKDQWLDYKFCLKYNLVDNILPLLITRLY